MKINIFFFLLLLSFGCNSPSQPAATPQQQTEAVYTVQKLPCEDPDWASDDTLFRSPDDSFLFDLRAGTGFSQKIKLKNGFLGIIAASEMGLDGLALALYQTDSLGRWRQTYCGEIEGSMNYEVSMPDLNFDGHKDLLIDGADGGVHGNHFFVLFLFAPENKTFRRCETPRLENLTIDSKNKQLRARHYGSLYGANIKSLYGWDSDSLVLLEEAVYHADVDVVIWLKKRQKDGTMKQDSITGKVDPLWDFFKGECVWKGGWDID